MAKAPMQCFATRVDEAENAWNETSVGGLISALKECSSARDLERGKQLHTQAIYSGHLGNKYVASSLISFYSKCGSTADARKVFDNLLHRDVVSCNALLQGYVDNGENELALEAYQIISGSSALNSRCHALAIAACSNLARAAEKHDAMLGAAKKIHSEAARKSSCDVLVETGMIILLCRCRKVVEARALFDSMPARDVVSWNSMLRGYVENGESERALELFEAMEGEPGCAPDARSYGVVLAACAALGEKGGGRSSDWLLTGKRIHTRASDAGLCDKFVANSLIDMYSKCGSMVDSRAVFDSLETRDVVSWTTLLHGYAHSGEHRLALELFDEMKGFSPVARTHVAALKACIGLNWLEKGEEIFAMARARGCCDAFVCNTFMELLVKSGLTRKARDLFDRLPERNSSAWMIMLHAHAANGEYKEALELFESSGCQDSRVYSAALSVCVSQKWLERGEAIFNQAEMNKVCDDHLRAAMVSLYVGAQRFVEAKTLLLNMGGSERTMQLWNLLIRGLVEIGENEEALAMLSTLDSAGFLPDPLTFVQAFSACTNLMSLRRGKALHARAQRLGLDDHLLVATSLVDFYSRCGRMDSAELAFESIPNKDSIAWNSLLSGFSSQGNSPEALHVFQQMEELGVAPNEATFVSLLVSCSHGGLAERGKKLFRVMFTKYGITPGIKHYSCMVDLFGRANALWEALKVVRSMPVEANAVVWHSLLAACLKWRNAEVGKLAYEKLMELDAGDESAYVMMANLCAEQG